jgi:hypothetical protein
VIDVKHFVADACIKFGVPPVEATRFGSRRLAEFQRLSQLFDFERIEAIPEADPWSIAAEIAVRFGIKSTNSKSPVNGLESEAVSALSESGMQSESRRIDSGTTGANVWPVRTGFRSSLFF